MLKATTKDSIEIKEEQKRDIDPPKKEKSESLKFPEVSKVPSLSTIKKSDNPPDEMYFGKLSRLPDKTLVLTNTPLSSIEDEEVIEKKEHFGSLKRKLELDEKTKDFTVPTSVPSSKTAKKEPEVESFIPTNVFQEVRKDKVTPHTTKIHSYEEPVEKIIPLEKSPISEKEEDIIPQDDDIDYVSGVGGLVTSSEITSSLLSRKK